MRTTDLVKTTAGLILIGSTLLPFAVSGSDSSDWQTRMRPISPRSYLCRHANVPIQIDGQLNEAAWAEAPWTEDFLDIQGAAQPRPKFRTRAKLLWDEQYLYIAAELEEPHVWATLTNHDSVIFAIRISRCLWILKARLSLITSSR